MWIKFNGTVQCVADFYGAALIRAGAAKEAKEPIKEPAPVVEVKKVKQIKTEKV